MRPSAALVCSVKNTGVSFDPGMQSHSNRALLKRRASCRNSRCHSAGRPRARRAVHAVLLCCCAAAPPELLRQLAGLLTWPPPGAPGSCGGQGGETLARPPRLQTTAARDGCSLCCQPTVSSRLSLPAQDLQLHLSACIARSPACGPLTINPHSFAPPLAPRRPLAPLRLHHVVVLRLQRLAEPHHLWEGPGRGGREGRRLAGHTRGPEAGLPLPRAPPSSWGHRRTWHAPARCACTPTSRGCQRKQAARTRNQHALPGVEHQHVQAKDVVLLSGPARGETGL